MWIDNLINIENVEIHGIPTTIFSPKGIEHNMPLIFFYHGWSSNRHKHLQVGSLLACHGYVVVIADSINHGERGSINYESLNEGLVKFWPTIINTLEEFPTLLDYMKNNYKIDENRIGVAGHSMGGIITSGIVAHNSTVASAVILNGSGAWEDATLDLIGAHYEKQKEIIDKGLEKLKPLIPIHNIENFKNTPLLILHGEKDNIVPIRSSKIFFQAVKEAYDKKHLVAMITFDRLNHYITEGMITEMINWFNTYLN